MFWLLSTSESAATTQLDFAWIYSGDQLGAEFGYAVGSAGDVNGDGFADVIIGAPKYDQLADQGGAVLAFYGGPAGLGTTLNWAIGSDLKGSRFGAAVSSAGDVNGDGFADVVVGAYRYNNGQPEEGRVFLYHGSATGLSVTPGWAYESDQAYAQLGISVAAAGDVNADGFDDVIIGARWYQLNAGAAFVFHGSAAGLDGTPDWLVLGPSQNGSAFGSAVSGAGDINADGFDDVIIGAPRFDTELGEDTGAAYVFYGSASGLPTTPNWSANGAFAGAQFGAAVASAKNLNGDSFADVIIGAPQTMRDAAGEGAAFVYFGSAGGLPATPNWSVFGKQEFTRLGAAVSPAGDINQDGFDEFIAGAPGYSNDQANEGAIFVYALGGGTALTWVGEGNKADTAFGAATAAAGDINHDGQADIIVGAPLFRIETDIRGRVFTNYGLAAEPIDSHYQLYIPIVNKN
jgi:hypothetical protein